MNPEQLFASVQGLISQKQDLRSLLVGVNEQLGIHLRAARVLSFISQNGILEPRTQVVCGPFEWVRHGRVPAKDDTLIELLRRMSRRVSLMNEALLVDPLSSTREEAPLWEEVEAKLGLVVPLVEAGRRLGCLLVLRDFEYERFRPEEVRLVNGVARIIAERIVLLLEGRELPATVTAGSVAEPYQRHVEQSQAIFLSLSPDGRVEWANRRAIDFFGVTPEALRGEDWRLLVPPQESDFLEERLGRAWGERAPFEEEIRIVNRASHRERVVLFNFSPRFAESDSLSGWDIIGVDVTARADARSALDAQTRKVQALYSVSAAIRGHLDPTAIGSRGLQSVLDACGADAGICFLCPPEDAGRLTLAAQRGLSDSFRERVARLSNVISFLRSVVEGRQPVVAESLQNDRRIPSSFAAEERMQSAVFVPILVENEAYGVMALFHRQAARFDGADVLLLSAAAGQIGLAARQSNLFTAYRRQTRNLLALYRISHELSSLKSLPEVFEQAFVILRDELGLKRVWLGLLGENGKIIGTAAFGPGWKRKLVEIVVDVSEPENPLAEVVQTQRPLLVGNPKAVFDRFGLARFFSRFALNSLALAPLVTRGQVLGVLAAQPGAGVRVNDEELSLLSSIANEIAALINTRRLEDRLIESERMQSTALLAAGIAHNFNNVLQAVLGQASLLEMQKMNPEQVEKAARTITESATRGATVVKQLLSVANLEEARRFPTNVNEFLKKEQQELLRLVPPHQTLKLSLKRDIPPALVDPNHLHRILLVLVKNAVEALRTKGFLIQIFSDAVQVDGKSLHFEVPEGEYVRIGVRDNGIGMDAETKRRCFDPFFSTKNVDPGTGLGFKGEGLGLAAAYALARKNGGRLSVESRLGQGALFTLFLPIQPVKEVSSREESGEKTEADSRRQGKNETPTS